MYSLILENDKKQKVELTHNVEYSVLEIQGLNPPSATINTSETALFDGGRFVSSKVDMRSINISIGINRNAESNRLALYKIVKPKQHITLYYKNGQRDVYIEGYVESIEVDYFGMKQTVEISILCPEPYFKNAEQMIEEVTVIIGAFHFPFAIEATVPIPFSYYDYEQIGEINIYNVGEVACGMTVEIYVNGTVTNPQIFNRETREFFGINYTFQLGDVVYITTQRGSKTVRLLRDGEYINLFNYIVKNSKWLQLEVGDNIFTYDADESTEENMIVRFIYSPLYGGV